MFYRPQFGCGKLDTFRDSVKMGKGNGRRPCLTGRRENELRWDLKEGRITPSEFEREMEKIEKVRNVR